MEKSTSIKNIASALIGFNLRVHKIIKDANNPFFKSKYASLSNILETIKQPLTESGLSFVQFPTGEHGLTTLLMHESGEFIQSTYEMRPVKADPQGIGSAITYQRRYALSAVLGLDIDDDDDANAASKPEAKQQGVKVNGNGAELPWLNEGTKEFDGAIQKIKAGKSSLEAVKKFFKVSKEIENKINEATKQAA